MQTTMKKKSKTRKTREAEMLCDLDKIDILLVSNHFEREDSELGKSTRRPGSSSYVALVDHKTNCHSNSGENEIRRFAINGQKTGETDSSSEINRLSVERNQRITQ